MLYHWTDTAPIKEDQPVSAPHDPTAAAAAAAEEPGHSALVSIERAPYLSTVYARNHRIAADEPRAMGGGDAGPTPYELLLASIGACKLITLRMYADRKGWPMESATIALSHTRAGAGTDLREFITAELELSGPLSPEQRARLAEIADRCPVHRTLSGDLTLSTTLVDDSSGQA